MCVVHCGGFARQNPGSFLDPKRGSLLRHCFCVLRCPSHSMPPTQKNKTVRARQLSIRVSSGEEEAYLLEKMVAKRSCCSCCRCRRLLFLYLCLVVGSASAALAVGSKKSTRGWNIKRAPQHHAHVGVPSLWRTNALLHASSNEPSLDDDSEETLLQLRLSVREAVDGDAALAEVQRYAQSFPFAVILPVQPMQYLPTHDGGVDVLFLRKRTQQKGTVDGGMRFYIRVPAENDITVLVKRNSNGQVVSKMFSEKLIIQAFVKGLSGEEQERIGTGPTDYVTVESVFHKWLDSEVTNDKS